MQRPTRLSSSVFHRLIAVRAQQRLTCPVTVAAVRSATNTTTSSGEQQHRYIDLPPQAASGCHVALNILPMQTEARIVEELRFLLDRQGEKQFAAGAGKKESDREVRNVACDMHGTGEYQELREWSTGKFRKLPGFHWTPALWEWCRSVAGGLIGSPDTPELPDSARIVEHHLPGFEMHTESPVVGRRFILLNLLSPCVLRFDDEATRRKGAVWLPERAALVVSGEARWGWRYGEMFSSTNEDRLFRSRKIPLDYRISVMLYKASPQFLDAGRIVDKLEATMQHAQRTKAVDQSKASNATAAASAASVVVPSEDAALLPPGLTVPTPPKQAAEIAADPPATTTGGSSSGAAKGSSGGVVIPDMEAAKHRMTSLKQDLSKVQSFLGDIQAKQKAGEKVTPEWLEGRVARQQLEAKGKDEYGFDAADPDGAWNVLNDSAKEYRRRLETMRYSNTSSTANAAPITSPPSPPSVVGALKTAATHDGGTNSKAAQSALKAASLAIDDASDLEVEVMKP